MADIIKKTAALFLLVSLALLSSCAGSTDISGFYEVQAMNTVYEFTSDGRIIENGVSDSISRYRIEGNKIITYIEDVPESEMEFDFRKDGDNFYMGELEYKKLDDPEISSEDDGEND